MIYNKFFFNLFILVPCQVWHLQARLDYDETFSPVNKPPTVRIILTLAAQFHWPLYQLDISNAFLTGYLKVCVL